MSRRRYDQVCSLASALDRVGERWAILVLRELSLGPLRFADLARAVGGAPTDVLTRRLRELERDGIVRRRELPPPAAATVYELTELGREAERPLLGLGRWGLSFLTLKEAWAVPASQLASAVRVLLKPPPELTLTVGLESEGAAFALRVAGGWVAASRGPAIDPDVTLAGPPAQVVLTICGVPAEAVGVAVTGDADALAALCATVALPPALEAAVATARPALPAV